jgi:PAS domain S-box-containing protein
MSTILIVDDLAANRKRIATILRPQEHRLLEASDGQDALVVARAEHPDLVITDVLMPVMDGYALVRQLRLDPATRGIPVVFSTPPYGEREARQFALSCGVSGVLTKPVQPEQVLTVAGRVLAGAAEVEEPDSRVMRMPFDRDHLALLNTELSEEAGELRAANARLRALINVGLELASEPDPELLLHRVCVAARDLFGATYVDLGLLEADEHTLRGFVTCGEDGTCGVGSGSWLVAGAACPGILGTVVTERRSARGDNPGGDPATLQLSPLHPDIRSFIVAPISSPAHLYGWMCLVRNEGHSFSEDDERLVTALSAQVGRIHENLSLVAAARKRGDELDREIRDRLDVESALRIAEARMRFAMESAGIGIWDLDFNTGALVWSDILESHYGLEPGTFGGTLDAFMACVHPEDRDALRQTIAEARRSGADFSLQHRALWPDGTIQWLSGAGRVRLGQHGEPVRGVGIIQDVTARHTLEAQFRQSQKMEAVGLLAGGVAHDFNNLLSVILGYSDVLLEDLGQSGPHSGDVAEIRLAAERAAALTRQLLAFSRQQIIEPVFLDLNEVVSDMRPMLGRLIPADIKVLLALDPVQVPVKADRGQVEQIVMNLVVNACDAMPRGGTLTIETGSVDIHDHAVPARLTLDPGAYVTLVVRDTGTGMTPAVCAHVFEAFFTTKAPGKGTGLGLATVQGIARQGGGDVSIDTAVDRGTSLRVYFPRAEAAADAAAPPRQAATRHAGAETVLVVDDSEEICLLTRKLLQRQGYTVLVALNTEDALQLIEQNPSIDVVLADVVMPGGSGPDLVRQLAQRCPAMRAIYMSGYGEEAIAQRAVLDPAIAFLQKPFTTETLGRKMREALG